jgi:hypothetical protein
MSGTSICVRPAATNGAARVRRVRRWLARFVPQTLSIGLFIGAAAAQTASGPVIDGPRPQPTRPQIDRREDDAVQREVDRLYDTVMRAAAPQTRNPSSQRLEAGAMR